MSERLTIRLDDGLRARLSDAAQQQGIDVSVLVRQAVTADLDGGSGTTPTALPPHDREACAQAILAGCLPEVRHEVSTRISRAGLPLTNLLEVLLTVAMAPLMDHAEQQGVELPTLLHQALVMLLDRASRAHLSAGSPHRPEDCGRVVLDHCPPAVQARMADALKAARGQRPDPEPPRVMQEAAEPVLPSPASLPPRHDTTAAIASSSLDPTPPRAPSPPPIVQTLCQRCGALLALGGTLCGPCTGAYLLRPPPPVCERCRQPIRYGGMGQRFCCQGCLTGQSHSADCELEGAQGYIR